MNPYEVLRHHIRFLHYMRRLYDIKHTTVNRIQINVSSVLPETLLSPVHPDELGVADLLVARHGDPAGEDVGGQTGAVQAGLRAGAAGHLLPLATQVAARRAAGVAGPHPALVHLLVQVPADWTLQGLALHVTLGTPHLLQHSLERCI